MKKAELLAPAGNLYKLKIALLYGADAVYIGGEAFSLRACADNFTYEEMKEGIEFAHSLGKKVYVTANIIPHNRDLEKMKEYFGEIAALGADAVLVSDLGAFMLCREAAPELEIHISTQANNTNYETVKAWHALGARRVVLAREMSLDEVTEIRRKIPEECELEAFVHGAMCISYSGRCLLSNYMTARDSNYGECSHPCRWQYALVEEKRPGEYMPVFENERGTFIMNSKDLCMIEHIPALIESGISSLKIEGRVKSEFYVATIVGAYRRALDAYYENPAQYKPDREILNEVYKVSHREYYTGFFFGMPPVGAQIYGSSSYIRDYDIAGIVIDYDEKTSLAKITQRNRFFKGDEVEIIRPGKPYLTQIVRELYDEEMNEITVANHAAQTLYMKTDVPVLKNAMLRKRTKTV